MAGKSDSAKKPPEIELLPDAWDRFERAFNVVAQSGPQHKVKIETNTKPPRKVGATLDADTELPTEEDAKRLANGLQRKPNW